MIPPFIPTHATCIPCSPTVGMPAPEPRVSERALRLADRLRRNTGYLMAAATLGAAANNHDLLSRAGSLAGYAERIAAMIYNAASQSNAPWSDVQLANALGNLKKYASDSATWLRQAQQAMLQQKVGADSEAQQLANLPAPAAATALDNAINAGRASPRSYSAFLTTILATAAGQAIELASIASSYLQGTD